MTDEYMKRLYEHAKCKLDDSTPDMRGEHVAFKRDAKRYVWLVDEIRRLRNPDQQYPTPWAYEKVCFLRGRDKKLAASVTEQLAIATDALKLYSCEATSTMPAYKALGKIRNIAEATDKNEYARPIDSDDDICKECHVPRWAHHPGGPCELFSESS